MNRVSRIKVLSCLCLFLGGPALVAGCASAGLGDQFNPSTLGVTGLEFQTDLFAGGGFGQAAPVGGFGATQGGVQDMGLARELLANGQVPPPEAFLVEGMFSEHDLGIEGETCREVLCLRGAAGIAPTLEGDSSARLQVGMSSNIDPQAFERPSLTLIATVDVSGSMGWDYATEETEYPTPGAVTRSLLRGITAQLGPQDRLAIVTYSNSVNTLLELTNGANQDTIQAAIDSLGTEGSTYMEAGLQRAYEIARQARDGETAETRVMLFTDVQPNVGATTETEFEQLVNEGAANNVGLTIMGVGVGLGQAVFSAMADVRGGNAFSLFDFDDVEELMEDDWPYLVSPLAYDLSVEIQPSDSFMVGEAYGFASDDERLVPGFDVSTVFLSRRKGALLIRFTPAEDVVLEHLTVSGVITYQTPDGESVEQRLQVSYDGLRIDNRGQHFEQLSVGKCVALAILVSGMAEAAEQYGEDPESAVAIMEAVVARFAADIESFNDESMSAEYELARELLNLMRDGADQGDLYGIGRQGY